MLSRIDGSERLFDRAPSPEPGPGEAFLRGLDGVGVEDKGDR
jgi:hypothetical protein